MCPLVSKNSLKAARARAPVHGGLMMSPRPLSGFWSEEVPQAGPEGAGVNEMAQVVRYPIRTSGVGLRGEEGWE